MDKQTLETANKLTANIIDLKRHEEDIKTIITRGDRDAPYVYGKLLFRNGNDYETTLRRDIMVMSLPDQITIYLLKLRSHIVELETELSTL